MLLAKNKGLSKEELDGAIERYLERTFGESVDFALENSLPFLVKDGLVRVSSSDSDSARLVAAPMPDALKALSAKWAAGIEPRSPGDGDAFALLTGVPGAALGAAGDAAALLLNGFGAGFKAVGKGLGGLGGAVGIGEGGGAGGARAESAGGARKKGGLFKRTSKAD
jgi:hypothetical protein